MNTFLLNFSAINGETIVLPCQKVEVNEAVVVVQSLLVDNPKIILLEIVHNQINTLLDLTKVTPYELWYFNQELIFSGKSFSIQNKNSLFQIQTQARYIALIPREEQNPSNTKLITDFECHSLKITEEAPIGINSFLTGYGIFPYIILKSGCALFMQIPIHINKNISELNFGTNLNDVSDEVQNDPEQFRELLIQHTQKIKNKIDKDFNKQCQLCLVLNASEGYYFSNTTFKKSDVIPTGGTLLTQGNKVIAMNKEHYLKT